MRPLIESRNQTKRLLAALALALLVAACGGSNNNGQCANGDCCGDGIKNPGEDCDGQDFGGATCMSTTQHGGTLRCSAECTFDVDQCTLASCGNGIVEDGEVCDGADLGGKTCASIGYAGGQLGCNDSCVYDVITCCSDACPSAGIAECVSNSVRECVAEQSGCLAWKVTDCGATNEVCEASGGGAACTCVDRCTNAGERRCESGSIETCQDVGGCLDWAQTTMCATGEVCTEIDTGPLCVTSASAEDCAHPYMLHGGQNIVVWAAVNADYLTASSCQSTLLDGPDLVLAYTAPENGFVHFSLAKGTANREVVVASSAACGMTTPELACVSDFSSSSINEDLSVTMGQTYYFYVRDTTSGTDPLPNPLQVTLDENLCSTVTPSVVSTSPGNNVSIPDTTPLLRANFDLPLDPSQGVITLTGNMGTNLTFDLATAPAAVALINGNKTLVIDPGVVFATGETVSVTWTGLRDSTCNKPVAPPTWSFALTGPPYSITTGATAFADACVGGTTLAVSGTTDEGVTAPITLPAGFQFFKQPATQMIASTNGWMSVDTSITTGIFSNVAIPATTNPNGFIAPYWNDLDVPSICTKTIGTKLVVQWTGTLFSSTTKVQFQAILDGADSTIEYVYGPNQQQTGVSTTVGVEDADGLYGVQYEFDTTGSITPNTSIKLTPN